MNLTYQLIKTEIDKLDSVLCKELKAKDDGKKFALLMLKKLSGYKKRELEKFYCDGGGDHQVDGVYIKDTNEGVQINIISCEFKQRDQTIDDKDITDLINNGLPYLFFNENKSGNISQKLKLIKDEIGDIRLDCDEKYNIVVKFITTSETVLSANGENEFSKFQADWQSKGVDIVYDKINGEQLSALFSSRSGLKIPIPIKLSGKAYYKLSGREGFICRLPVQQLINIYFGFKDGERTYPGYGMYLFEDNVRKNLGLDRNINQKIFETATDNNKAIDFEYFNNGLTIIYDEQTGGNFGQDSPILYINGLQVVNGCQTVSTLIKAHEDKKLSGDIYITCRFIKRSEDKKFIQSVITFTNSQNAISCRDLHSNDRIQYDIQGILQNMGISYERKLNEFREETDDKRIDALEAAQAYLCCELQEPYRAKQQKKDLFDTLYGRIFDPSKVDLAYKLFVSYKILDYALNKKSDNQRKKRQIKKKGGTPHYRMHDLIIAHGSYHIAALLYKKFFSSMTKEQIKHHAENFNYPETIDIEYKSAIKYIEKDIKGQNIGREKLAQHFKSLDSYRHGHTP